MPSDSSLRGSRDFRRVYAEGSRTRRDGLVVWAAVRPGGGTSRLGLAVGRTAGSAVDRNRIRRRLRAAWLAEGPRPGFDVVIRAERDAAVRRFQDLRADLSAALRRLEVVRAAPGSES